MIAPREEVAQTALAEHGGRRAVDGGSDRSGIVRQDFSVCLNAFGPADVVVDAMADAVARGSAAEYPDPRSRQPRAAAARLWCCPEERIVFGAGAAELIHAVCFAYIRRNDAALIAAPAFAEYARAAALCGGRVQYARVGPSAAGLDAFVGTIARLRPRVVFVASPMNPTGETLAIDLIREIADACAAIDALLVLDQAYDAFTTGPLGGPALAEHSHVVHLRSLTKEHALAGVRAGFAIAPAAIADALERVRVPWSASTIAQAAATAALTVAAAEHVARTTAILRAERSRMSRDFASRGIEVHPSATHFFLLRVGDAAAARGRLLAHHGLLVRDCASFGLPEWIRVAARTPAANDLLIAALASDTELVTSQ